MTTKKQKEERKVFYYQEDKPVTAAGILFIKEETKEVLVQRLPKEDGFIYTDFGGKIDMSDESVMDTISRELGEEINYGIYLKKDKIYLDEKSLKEIIENNTKNQLYIPFAKYLLTFTQFDSKILALNMKIIGEKEKLDDIQRTVQWISYDEFISAHFDHKLHPRLWNKSIIEYLGYKSDEEVIVKKLTKFAFK